MAGRDRGFVIAGEHEKCARKADEENQSDDNGFDFRFIASHGCRICAGLCRRLSLEIAGVFPAGQRMRRQVIGGAWRSGV